MTLQKQAQVWDMKVRCRGWRSVPLKWKPVWAVEGNKPRRGWAEEKRSLFNIRSGCHVCMCVCVYVQWGKKVFSQPPIVQVLPLKKMRPIIYHRYTSTMTDKMSKEKNPENHILGFLMNLFANYGGK
jgi:hypothetical protein